MPSHKNQRFSRRLRFALNGLAAGLRSERSLRVQCIVLACVAVALIVMRVEPIWWALVAVTSAMVVCAELLNTAVEHLVDHLHPNEHPKIGLVKDFAAAAVLVAAAGALLVGFALIVHLWSARA